MTRFVIDAVTLLRIVDGARPDGVHQLVAPGSVRSEATQLVLDDVVHGRRTVREARTVLERVAELKIRLLGDRVSRRTAFDLALEHGWTVRDAEYVAVTQLQADVLVAGDPRLVAVADQVVPTVGFEALLAP